MSLCIVGVHLIMVSGFAPWYGGHCYGPRYSTGIVPWFALLAILAVESRLQWHNKQEARTRPIFGEQSERSQQYCSCVA